ncbi:glycine oxidase [Haloechinothrix alba]|uniref:glycine oxidase n=1 Tax=Haloechinothrix alba TaxID=664784 RepID=A0A238XBF8_9PSEU|nr:glycine oxidase ThiO [Haloechinothrix alba]SNR56030.1 glycine oxidase [Haloechinothrix alba]
MTSDGRVAVVGGGVIGLSVAWRLSTEYAVTLFDPVPARGASWVAGGMLAPATEAWPGEESALELGEESLRRWPDFAAELRQEASDPGLSTAGTVVAAADRADAEYLEVLAAYLHGVGRHAEIVSGRTLRTMVPGLATSVRRGLSVPGDLAVDTRKLLGSLRAAATRRGCHIVCEEVTEVAADRVVTVVREHTADAVVLAAGARSALLHSELREAVRPLKGEILRLRARRTSLPPPDVTVRAMVEGRPMYLVPREGGELVLGATQYEAGYDETVTAGGVRDLLERAEQVFPSVVEYELVEAAAALRAASSDTVPLIGRLDDGVYVASGHHRNGLLLAPVTADAVLAQLGGHPLPAHVDAAHPRRYLAGRESA